VLVYDFLLNLEVWESCVHGWVIVGVWVWCVGYCQGCTFVAFDIQHFGYGERSFEVLLVLVSVDM